MPTEKTRVLAYLVLRSHLPLLWALAEDRENVCYQVPQVQKLPVKPWVDFMVNAMEACTRTHLSRSVLVRLYQRPEQGILCISFLCVLDLTMHLSLNQIAQKLNALAMGSAPLSVRLIDIP